MRFNSVLSGKILSIVLIPLLTSCASIVPGMHMTDTREKFDNTGNVVFQKITPEFLARQKTLPEMQPTLLLQQFVKQTVPYEIGRGDVLSITVWDHPQLNLPTGGLSALDSAASIYPIQSSDGYVVDSDGYVQFPAIGPVKLGGMTQLAARNLLAKQLDKVVKEPKITLRVREYRSQRVYVEGDVKTPGTQTISDVPMTLTEAIGRAGGFLPTADQSRVTIVRNGQNYPVDFPTLARSGIDTTKIMLASGDIVRVQPATENKVYVMGEVVTPKALNMNNGRLTLNDALGEVGGPNPLSADARQIYVIRNAEGAHPIVYNLEARSPAALALAAQFDLLAKDVVFVDATALIKFSRIIGSIIPTAATAATISGAVTR